MEHADKKQKAEIDRQLDQPPPGATAEQIRETVEWEPGAAGASFMAQMAGRGGAGRVAATGVRNV